MVQWSGGERRGMDIPTKIQDKESSLVTHSRKANRKKKLTTIRQKKNKKTRPNQSNREVGERTKYNG